MLALREPYFLQKSYGLQTPSKAHGYDPILPPPPPPPLSPKKKKEERQWIILDSWSKIDFHWYTYNNNNQALFSKFWAQLWIFNRKINVSQMYSTATPMREINNIRRESFFVASMFAGIFEHVWSSFEMCACRAGWRSSICFITAVGNHFFC